MIFVNQIGLLYRFGTCAIDTNGLYILRLLIITQYLPNAYKIAATSVNYRDRDGDWCPDYSSHNSSQPIDLQ